MLRIENVLKSANYLLLSRFFKGSKTSLVIRCISGALDENSNET